MNNIIYVFIIAAFLILFGLIVWLLSIVFREKKEAKDSPIDLNFLSHFDTGCFIGTEISSVGAKDNYHFIKMLPKDIDIDKLNKNEVIKPVSIIVENNKICSFPKGTLSKDKNINFLLPKKSSDFHETVKDSIIGKGLMLAVELQNSSNAEINSLIEGHIRKDEILKRIGNAEISKEFLTFQSELYQDMLRTALEAKTKDRSSIVPSSTMIRSE